MTYVRADPPDLVGLDLSTAKIHLPAGAAQRCENFDLERRPGLRVRAGYARLLDASSNAVTTTGAATRLYQFERDDNAVRLLLAHGTVVDAVAAGGPAWS